MDPQPGQSLSHYRLIEKIGEGGMGVVWKAHDTTLGRDVALKLLPDLFAGDADRRARFEREAKLLASLSHPGIATIHGYHESGGIHFLAMELAPGRDLSRRLAGGPLPIEEALEIAVQVAAALEAAHDSGVVHRDLKPGNIQVAADGKVKVLDFGLAKALDPDPSATTLSLSPTLTSPATRAGVILGTAAYMSPEQAKGKPVDRRADIWAFGCVLYEMLVGRRPFSGEGVTETIAAVIMSPVDLDKIPAATPASIRRLLRRCLDKDPRRRLRDIGEARIVLEETLAGKAEETQAISAASPAAGRLGVALPMLAVALVAGLALGAAVMYGLSPRQAPAAVRRFEMPGAGPFRATVQSGPLLSISPDGTRVAYAEAGGLRIRQLDRTAARQIPTAAEPAFIFWSPDSAWLGYGVAGQIWKVPSDGGEAVVISEKFGAFTGGAGASWGADGRIVVARGDGGLQAIAARGGEARQLLPIDPNLENDLHQPSYLPDGSGVLFVSHSPGGMADRLWLLANGARKELLHIAGQEIYYPTYAASGHILFRRQPANPGIWALPFSLKDHAVTGEAFLVATDGDVPSVSTDGTLVYAHAAASRDTQLAWVDRNGKLIATIGEPQQSWPFPVLSPDGRRVALAAAEGDRWEVWLYDAERMTRSRITFGANATYAVPAWFSSGQQIVYDDGSSFPFSLRVIALDGNREVKEIAKGWGSRLSADDRYLVYADLSGRTSLDLWYVETKPGSQPVRLVQAQSDQIWPRPSPDGRLVAYLSDDTGREEVYLTRFPSGEGRWQVSVSGGYWPHWSLRGDRLYYVDRDKIMEVEVSLDGDAPKLGQPRMIFERRALGFGLLFGWPAGFDVSADGQRFLLCLPVAKEAAPQGYVLVQNWASEFRQGK